jgi:hypothetical protein
MIRNRAFLLAALALVALPRPAPALDLPVRSSSSTAARPARGLRDDCIEIRLTQSATSGLRRNRPGATSHRVTSTLGLASLDAAGRVANAIGYEPEFVGETPPAPGSRRTDFTAFYRVWLAPGN